MLENLLVETKPKLIIELGTGSGALTNFLRMHARTYTYDVENSPFQDVFSRRVYCEIKLLTEHVKTLFFCDDGDKPLELKTYWPLVKRCDHVLVHDWKRPGGIWPKDLAGLKGRSMYRQDEFDRLKTYILSLVKA